MPLCAGIVESGGDTASCAGGVNWIDKPLNAGETKSIAGLTVGAVHLLLSAASAATPALLCRGGVLGDDTGHSWAGGAGQAGATYQDYRITTVDVQRRVVKYDCCPVSSPLRLRAGRATLPLGVALSVIIALSQEAPYPTLLYGISFERSGSHYSFAMVVPAVMLALCSFISFFLSPATGERLGFGMLVILAMVVNDIFADSLMPRCIEKVRC